MSKVLTQKDVAEIVDNAVVAEQAASAVGKTMQSLTKIIEKIDIKQLEKGDKKMLIMKKMMTSYTSVLGDIITTLNTVTPEGKEISKILGRVYEEEKDSEGKIKKVEKWTNLDALIQVSNIMSTLIKGITANDKVEKMGFFAKRKFKKNVLFSVDLAMYGFRTMIEELSKVTKTNELKDLMSVLVDGPDIINEMQSHNEEMAKGVKSTNGDSKDEYRKVYDTTSKVTKKGKVGIITAMKNVFDLLKMMLEIEPPGVFGMLAFRIKVMRFGSMLKIAIKEFSKVLQELGSKELLELTNISSKIVNGTGKEGEEGLMGVVTNMLNIVEIIKDIPDLKKPLKKLDKIKIMFNKLLNDIIDLFVDRKTFKPKKEIDVLISKDLNDILEKVKESLQNLIDTFVEMANVCKKIIILAVLAIPAIIAMIPVMIFIWALAGFVKVVDKAFDVIAKVINRDMKKDIKEFANLLFSLGLIQLSIITIALFAKTTIIAMIIVTAFIWALAVFTLLVNWAFDIIAMIINRDMNKNIREFAMLLLNIALIQASIILLAILSFTAIKAMIILSIFFVTLVVFTLIVNWVFDAIAKIIDRDFKKDLNEFIRIILMIALVEALLIIMGAFAIKAIVSTVLVIAFLIGLMIFTLILWVVLKITDKLIKGQTYMALFEVIIIIALLLVIEFMLVIMGKIAVDAIIGVALGLVFLVLLIVFIAIIGVIGYLLNSYGTMLTGPAIAGLATILLIIGLLVGIAALLVVLGNMWDAMNFGGIMGVLGTVMLVLVMLIVIGVLALAASIALPGLAIGIVTATLLLGVVAILSKVQESGLSMEIMGTLAATMAAIGMIIVIGMMGLGAILAIAFMPMNIALVNLFFPVATKLAKINSYNLNKDELIEKVWAVRSVLNSIKSAFGSFEFSFRRKRKAKRALNNAASIISPILRIVRKLNRISKLTLDETAIMTNIGLVFATVEKIEEFIEKLSEVPKDKDGNIDFKALVTQRITDYIKGKAAAGKMNRTDRILVKVYSITSKLNDIQSFKLQKDKIMDNLTLCFDIIGKIEEYIKTQDELPADYTKDDIENWKKKNAADRLAGKVAQGKIGRADAILLKMHDITKSLDEIMKIKLNQSDVIEKVGEMFDVIDTIDKIITERSGADKYAIMSWWDQDDVMDRIDDMNEIKDAQQKDINRVAAIMSNINSITKTLDEIMKIKITPGDVIVKVNSILDCVNEIYRNITLKSIEGGWFGGESSKTNSETIKKVCEEINMLNTSLKGLNDITDADVKNTKATLDNYSKFVTKIDTLKFENLEKGAQLFEHMSRFSESISGNFEKLSESINEDLMPVLEELKKIMAQVPEAVEKSSANISASVAANNNNQLSKSENVAQIQRENPNISEPEAVKKALERTQQQAAKQADSVSAKLDKLISMLSNGSAKIKTSIW